MNFLDRIRRRKSKPEWVRDLNLLGIDANDKTTVQQAKSLIVKLNEQNKVLTHRDIAAWRRAHQLALNVENPKRIQLYDIYDFTTSLDAHVEGVWLRIRTNLKQKKFKIIDAKTKKEREDLTDLFESIWFKDFLELIVETKFYGHTLVEFGDLLRIDGKLRFRSVEAVPRRHVCPEYEVLLIDQNDEPQKGIPYNTGNLADWSIEIGKRKDLGAFLKASPKAIAKKHVEIFWDEFAERFGIPILFATTNVQNETERMKINNFMRNFGAAPSFVFGEGTKLEAIQTTSGDAYMVFDQRILRCEQQISKCLAGQTMSFDDGASRSQGETHLKGFEEILESFADDARDIINNNLFPFLAKHGFPVTGTRFDWDYTYEFKPEEIQREEELLLQHYEIDPSYFVEKYNIPIIGKKTQHAKSEEEDEDENDTLVKKKDYYLNFPDYEVEETEEVITLAKKNRNRFWGIHQRLIKKIWESNGTRFDFDLCMNTYSGIFENFARGIMHKNALKLAKFDVGVVYDHPNRDAITMMEANIFRFSDAKTQAEVIELNSLARKSKNFDDFNEAAKKILDKYNGTYLATEFLNAHMTGVRAAEYWDMLNLADVYPYWQYHTMDDDRVRESHAVLNNVILPADDPAWDIIYPPNGWRCRCYVHAVHDDKGNLADGKEVLNRLAGTMVGKNGMSALDVMRKQGFAVNRAKAQVAFTESQMYLKKDFAGKLGVKHMYGDNSMLWENIDKTKLPAMEVRIKSNEEAWEWFTKNAEKDKKEMSMKDYAGRTIVLNNKTLKNHLKNTDNYALRHRYIDHIPEVLEDPDEVWFVPTNRSKSYQYSYIKFFKNEMMLVPVVLEKGQPFRVATWFPLKGDDNRKGVLIKKAKK